MSLKDNFNQAVKELLKRDGLVGDNLNKNAKEKTELDRYLDTPSANSEPIKPAHIEPPPMPATPMSVRPISAPQTPPPTAQRPTQTPSQSLNDFTGGSAAQTYGARPSAPMGVSQPMDSTPYFETEETTVISRNTVVDGNIKSFANVNIEGSVKGNVQITKNASLSGKVVGDLECNNATMLGSSMQGNVASKGQVKMDRDSVMLGDINAQYLDLNGKVRGNIDISGKAEFKTDAIIFGNINASTITVLDEATIQGFVNTTFLQESATNIFPETIVIAE